MAQVLRWTITIFQNETRVEGEATFYFAANNGMVNEWFIQVTVHRNVLVWVEGQEPFGQLEVQIYLLLQFEGTVLDAQVPPDFLTANE